jgi:hypothetical protein
MKGIHALFFLMFFLSCSRDLITEAERWEGIDKGKLRVFVRYDFTEQNIDGVYGRDFEKKIDPVLMEDAEKRAYLIIAGYAEDCKRNEKPCEINITPSDLGKGRLVSRNCTEDFCQAIVDFEIKK